MWHLDITGILLQVGSDVQLIRGTFHWLRVWIEESSRPAAAAVVASPILKLCPV